jgi:hypothetical protein
MGFFASYRARIRRQAVAATAPDPDVRDQVDRQMRRGPWFREVGVASSAFWRTQSMGGNSATARQGAVRTAFRDRV